MMRPNYPLATRAAPGGAAPGGAMLRNYVMRPEPSGLPMPGMQDSMLMGAEARREARMAAGQMSRRNYVMRPMPGGPVQDSMLMGYAAGSNWRVRPLRICMPGIEAPVLALPLTNAPVPCATLLPLFQGRGSPPGEDDGATKLLSATSVLTQ